MKGFDVLREHWKATLDAKNLPSLLDEKLSTLFQEANRKMVRSSVFFVLLVKTLLSMCCVRGEQH